MNKHYLKKIFASSFEQESEHFNISYLFKRVLIVFILLSLLMLLICIYFKMPQATLLASSSLISFALSYILLDRKHSENAAAITVGFTLILGLLSIYNGNGIHDTAIFLFPVFFLISSFLLRRVTFLIISFLALVGLVLIGIGEINGSVTNKFATQSTTFDIIFLTFLCMATILIIHLFSIQLQRTLNFAQNNAINYQKIFNSVSEAIIINDISSGKIISVNEPMLSMFSYDTTDISQLDMNTLIVSSDGLTYDDILIRTNKNIHSQPQIYSWFGVKQSGEHFQIEISISLTTIDGFKRVLTVIRDVDEKNKFDEKVKQNEKMVALGRLAGGIAHDFRNQLTGIMGCAELLKSELPTKSHKESLDLIIKSAQQSSSLTQQLLFFSRKGDTEYHHLNINELIETTVSILKRSIDKRITIQSSLDFSVPMILGDTGRIQNAILNLCINACDSMPEGGTLKIKTDTVLIDAPYKRQLHESLAEGSHLRVQVIDTGIGIPTELHQKIFEPLFTTKPIGKGTGMGLSAVYGTICDHGGSINLISKNKC